MPFNSVTFIFAFLPVCLGLFVVVGRRRARDVLVLIASAVFYAYGGLGGVAVLMGSIAWNYVCGVVLDARRARGHSTRGVLGVGVAGNVVLLAGFKYLPFAAATASALTGLRLAAPQLVMPIGVSFFTFEGISYLVDLYRGRAAVRRNPLDIALHMGFFATIMAGPIVRAEEFQEQQRTRAVTLEGAAEGARRFVIGLAKKAILASGLGTLANAAFATPTSRLSVAAAWIGAFAFTGQIYFDFSGYSDMAIGVGRMFGMRLPENFDYPYVSQSATEFWRRWHMSLGRWFREYVYIPLGGNRVSVASNLRNLFIVWALTGLWHGARWSFVVWGLYYGVLLGIEKFILGERMNRVWRPVRHTVTMLAVVVGWVIFKSDTLPGALGYLGAMAGAGAHRLVDQNALYYLQQYRFELLVGTFAALPLVPWLREIWARAPRPTAVRTVLAAGALAGFAGLFVVSISYLLSTTFTPFLYFKF